MKHPLLQKALSVVCWFSIGFTIYLLSIGPVVGLSYRTNIVKQDGVYEALVIVYRPVVEVMHESQAAEDAIMWYIGLFE